MTHYTEAGNAYRDRLEDEALSRHPNLHTEIQRLGLTFCAEVDCWEDEDGWHQDHWFTINGWQAGPKELERIAHGLSRIQAGADLDDELEEVFCG